MQYKHNLLFHCNEVIFLLPNTIIEQGSEVIIDAGNLCDGKGNNKSKYDTYNNKDNISFYHKTANIPIEEKHKTSQSSINKGMNKEIVFFPNPNKGEFYIQSNSTYTEENIQLFNAMGGNIPFSILNNRIKLGVKYQGVLFLKLLYDKKSKEYKIIIQ